MTPGAGAPLRSPSVERSSSISSHLIPNPPPEILHLFLCLGVACKSLGNQASGTDIVLPSSRSTTSAPLAKPTPFTISPALSAEEFIPGLQKFFLVPFYQFLDLFQFSSGKPDIGCKRNRFKPELSRKPFAINMDMGRFIWLVAKKVKSEWPRFSNVWSHTLTACRLNIPILSQFGAHLQDISLRD